MMMMTIRLFRFVLVVSFFLLSNLALSQIKDACLWSSIDAKTSLFKNLQLKIEIAYRLNENVQQTEKIYAETGFEYQLNKIFSIAGKYRFIKKNLHNDHFFATRHLYGTELKTTYVVNQFEFNWTSKYQINQFDNAEHDWGNTKLTSCNRNKFSIEYRIKKAEIKIYFFYEMFVPLFSSSYYFVNEHRTGFGLKYNLNNTNAVKLTFMFEEEKDNDEIYNNFIGSIAYSIKL